MLRLHKILKKPSFPTLFQLSKMDFVANVNKMYYSLFQLKGVVCVLIFPEHKRGLFSKLMAADHSEWLQFKSQSCVPAFRWMMTCHAESRALHRKRSWAQTESEVLRYAPATTQQTLNKCNGWPLTERCGDSSRTQSCCSRSQPRGLTWVNGCTSHVLTNAGFQQRNVKYSEQTTSVMLRMDETTRGTIM